MSKYLYTVRVSPVIALSVDEGRCIMVRVTEPDGEHDLAAATLSNGDALAEAIAACRSWVANDIEALGGSPFEEGQLVEYSFAGMRWRPGTFVRLAPGEPPQALVMPEGLDASVAVPLAGVRALAPAQGGQ